MKLMRSLVVLSLIVLPLVTEGALTGGWQPIKNLKDREVEKIAKYAVAKHNKHYKMHLKLERIVSGQTQVVAGTNYKLIIATSNCKIYEAIVWEKPCEHFRKLISFRALLKN